MWVPRGNGEAGTVPAHNPEPLLEECFVSLRPLSFCKEPNIQMYLYEFSYDR